MEAKYYEDELGVIRMLNFKEFTYTDQYLDKHRNLSEHRRVLLAKIRYEYIVTACDYKPFTVFDIGYGLGDFLTYCKSQACQCYGNDLIEGTIPEGCQFTDIDDTEYDLVTMFDSLEHFTDTEFLHQLNCKYFAVSVPWLPTRDHNSDLFRNWRHFRPDEHTMHFDNNSLANFIESHGFKLLASSNVEDVMRPGQYRPTIPNILTQVFKKI